MAKGKKTGGRQKGTPNKDTAWLHDICEQEGVMPFREMIIAAKQIDEPKSRCDAFEKVSQYLYPKRKAMELTGKEGEDLGIKIVIEDYGKK